MDDATAHGGFGVAIGRLDYHDAGEDNRAQVERIQNEVMYYCITPVAFFGFLLNLLALWVWTAEKRSKILFFCFKSLAALDTVYIPTFTVWWYIPRNIQWAKAVLRFIFPSCTFLIVFVTTAISVIRYVTVFHPETAQAVFTYRSVRLALGVYGVFIVVDRAVIFALWGAEIVDIETMPTAWIVHMIALQALPTCCQAVLGLYLVSKVYKVSRQNTRFRCETLSPRHRSLHSDMLTVHGTLSPLVSSHVDASSEDERSPKHVLKQRQIERERMRRTSTGISDSAPQSQPMSKSTTTDPSGRSYPNIFSSKSTTYRLVSSPKRGSMKSILTGHHTISNLSPMSQGSRSQGSSPIYDSSRQPKMSSVLLSLTRSELLDSPPGHSIFISGSTVHQKKYRRIGPPQMTCAVSIIVCTSFISYGLLVIVACVTRLWWPGMWRIMLIIMYFSNIVVSTGNFVVYYYIISSFRIRLHRKLEVFETIFSFFSELSRPESGASKSRGLFSTSFRRTFSTFLRHQWTSISRVGPSITITTNPLTASTSKGLLQVISHPSPLRKSSLKAEKGCDPNPAVAVTPQHCPLAPSLARTVS